MIKKLSYSTFLLALIGLFCACSNNNGTSGIAHQAFLDTEAGGFVLVKGGSFEMGCSSGQQPCHPYEKPVHKVTIDDFYMGETEVTQAQWQAVMGSNPSWNKGCGQCPVERVSWYAVQDFITRLNRKSNGITFRMPTEAEWEFAARGGKKSRGLRYAGSSTLMEVAWYRDNAGDNTHPVKSKFANELGLYDMSGNVWEWCADFFDDYKVGSQKNPSGPSTGTKRVLRGGSRASAADVCSISRRSYNVPDDSSSLYGFRLAISTSDVSIHAQEKSTNTTNRSTAGKNNIEKAARPSSISVRTPNGSNLRMRSLPSEDGSILASIPNASALELIAVDPKNSAVSGTTGHWLMVRYNGRSGWVWGPFTSYRDEQTAAAKRQEADKQETAAAKRRAPAKQETTSDKQQKPPAAAPAAEQVAPNRTPPPRNTIRAAQEQKMIQVYYNRRPMEMSQAAYNKAVYQSKPQPCMHEALSNKCPGCMGSGYAQDIELRMEYNVQYAVMTCPSCRGRGWFCR